MTRDDDTEVSTLPLFALPYAFTQVELLTAQQFQKAAREWGHPLSHHDLQKLMERRLLVPFFELQQSPGVGVPTAAGDETREAVLAREGHLTDPGMTDGPPTGEPRFSRWQLLGLRKALWALRTAGREEVESDEAAQAWAARTRTMHVALAALTNRFYPGIVGQRRVPIDADGPALRRAARDLSAGALLDAVNVPPDRLLQHAKDLLTWAHGDDPLGQWWQIARYSNAAGWFRLRNAALEAVWQRIAAEVLLRAHEELAQAGTVPAIDVGDTRWWQPLNERISATGPTTPGLDHALSRLGVSPHPAVVVVVEGETEELHVNALLSELAIGERVRVVSQRTSGDHPHELARFLAPQVREVLPDRQVLERNPTLLFVAMDPEGPWGPEKYGETVAKLRQQIRGEVRRQPGADVTDKDLDELLNVRTWPGLTYELANFTDDELTDALLAVAPADAATDSLKREVVAGHVRYARSLGADFKVVLDRLKWKNLKKAVAEYLIPQLIAKLDDDEPVPVVELVWDIDAAARRMAVGTVYLSAPGADDDEPATGETATAD